VRVGLYVHDYMPVSGGGYTFQREILKAISSIETARHRFVALAHRKDGLPDSIESVSIEQLASPSSGPLGKLWSRMRNRQASFYQPASALDVIAKKHHIDFIWFVTPAYEPTDVPYLATVWDLQHRLQPWFPEVGNRREWEGREAYITPYLKRATYIVTPNQVGQKEITLFYQIPEDRILCLPHPTPELVPITLEDERATLAKYSLEPGFLFYPAQYWTHKNHANVLFALKILKETYGLMLTVVFVGSDKGNLAYLKTLAVMLNVQSQLHFLTFVSDRELTAFYKSALALIYPSFFGPENLPPLEAFSVGCPVIAANVSGANEQLGDAALLFNPSRAEEIATAIKTLIEDPQQRETLIARGSKRAKQTTSLHYARRVLSVLDEFESTRRCWGS
jgi:glycosyltransferase involved in cell wall biosynthesis